MLVRWCASFSFFCRTWSIFRCFPSNLHRFTQIAAICIIICQNASFSIVFCNSVIICELFRVFHQGCYISRKKGGQLASEAARGRLGDGSGMARDGSGIARDGSGTARDGSGTARGSLGLPIWQGVGHVWQQLQISSHSHAFQWFCPKYFEICSFLTKPIVLSAYFLQIVLFYAICGISQHVWPNLLHIKQFRCFRWRLCVVSRCFRIVWCFCCGILIALVNSPCVDTF